MTEQQIVQKLAALCSASEHCTHEMEEKMCKWEVDEATQARVIAYLIKEKYIDEERYCRFFVNDKVKFNHWGRKKIEQALFLKRVPKDIQKKVLDEVPFDDYVDALRPLLIAKEKTVKARNEYEKSMKLIRYAMGRGFQYDVIKECLLDLSTDSNDCFDLPDDEE